MGGAAHKDSCPQRVTSEERLECIDFFQDRLEHVYDILTSPWPAPEKQNHGDVDLLVVLKPFVTLENVQIALKQIGLHSKRHHSYLFTMYFKNGITKLIQVDFMIVEKLLLPICQLMSSYGDVGMILGVCTKQLGYKLNNTKGLQYMPDKNYRSKVYPLSLSPQEITCKYLNLDYDQWLRGFTTEEEAFEWFVSMRPASINAEKVGQKYRPMFSRFCEWNEKRIQKLTAYEKNEETHWRETHAIDTLKKLGKLDEIKKSLQQDLEKDEYNKNCKMIFNANTITHLLYQHYPDIAQTFQREKLGLLMKDIRGKLPTFPSLPTVTMIESLLHCHVKRFFSFESES